MQSEILSKYETTPGAKSEETPLTIYDKAKNVPLILGPKSDLEVLGVSGSRN